MYLSFDPAIPFQVFTQEKRKRMCTKRHERTFWDDRNVLQLDPGDGYTCVYLCQNSLTFTLKVNVRGGRGMDIGDIRRKESMK